MAGRGDRNLCEVQLGGGCTYKTRHSGGISKWKKSNLELRGTLQQVSLRLMKIDGGGAREWAECVIKIAERPRAN
jgi:hypothetical protein